MSLGYRFQPIDVTIEGHPKAWAAGPEAMGLWLWGMVHAKQHATRGRISRVAALGAWGGKRNVMLAKRLVDSGLWLTREDGDWDVYNFDSKSAGSSKSTERVKRFRERSRSVSETRSSETSVSSSSSVSISSPPDIASRPPLVLGLDGEGGEAWQAWKVGIGRATGRPVSDLQARDKPDLVALSNAHAGGLRAEALMVWITDTAAVFAREVDAKFGNLTTKRCREWLDAGRPARAAPGGRHVQSADNRAWKLPEGGNF